jgi:ribosomal protein L37AE/L43A
MTEWEQEHGEIHNRLMKNHCPKCDTPMIVRANREMLIRKCNTCKLEVRDKLSTAEYPGSTCDVCD